MCGTCGCNIGVKAGKETRRLAMEINLLNKNDQHAKSNRLQFKQLGLTVINLMSSPGSGKTRLLEATLPAMSDIACAVIEGDQQTNRDAKRIQATGVTAIQINTGKGCHLDAQAVGYALEQLPLDKLDLLLIENVGNLVCPAAFDLGEAYRAVILSVTEGEDKPLKYPDMFYDADVVIINKTDLLPYLEFDLPLLKHNILRINAEALIIEVSAQTGEGLSVWLDWLRQKSASTTTV